MIANNRIIKRNLGKLVTGLLLTASCLSQAASLDDKLQKLAQDPAALADGKQTFETVCAACHAKDLSGGAGFNLKDEEWVHGDKPSQIYQNVVDGFMDKGMPGFGAIYKAPKLENVVAYVLSKRQGLANLSYKIYPVETQQSQKHYQLPSDINPSKSGPLANNLIDFNLPEINNYVIEFEGDLYAPTDQATKLHAMTSFKHRTELFIDGKMVEPEIDHWQKRIWPLKKGKQHIVMRYYRINQAKNLNSRINIFVLDNRMKEKLFAISVQGKQFLKNATIPIKAEQTARIVRKKVVDLPTFSISVGLPQQVNYAFNTRSCSIVGMWTGDFINVGPNVEGRARDGSLILGEWAFKHPQEVAAIEEMSCHFEQYRLSKSEPEFIYHYGDNKIKLTAQGQSSHQLILNYQLLSGDISSMRHWQLPQGDDIDVDVAGGRIEQQQLVLEKSTRQWQITITKKGKE
ncbi:c-type cytochrome [Gayadomonas joobiniege]|uniref:c-type cytochrome n=1 Tax=Gayadomonas joobiniege TaxID=1234606 RepID=UPI00036C2DF1|nr:c-type cytochrome [Gayadomonas joobiniege]